MLRGKVPFDCGQTIPAEGPVSKLAVSHPVLEERSERYAVFLQYLTCDCGLEVSPLLNFTVKIAPFTHSIQFACSHIHHTF